MSEKPISLHKRRVAKLAKMVDDSIEEANEEFSYIDDELIDFSIQKGDITLNTAVKTIWWMAGRMDHFEQEILKLKLLILEGAEGGVMEKKQEDIYIGHFDGSATPNPGVMVIGGIIKDIAGNTIREYSKEIGEGTNNQAEYVSLINLLKEAKEVGIKNINIKGDSLLVVNQITGVWKAKNAMMRRLKLTVLDLLKDFDKWSISHIPRKDNKEADSLT